MYLITQPTFNWPSFMHVMPVNEAHCHAVPDVSSTQNVHHFQDDIFERIAVNENV